MVSTSLDRIHTTKCTIIGMLEDGVESLNQHALERLKSADVVMGTPRFLAGVKSLLKDAAESRDFSGQLMKVPEWIDVELKENKQVVIVATGDPLCHGIGSFLSKKLGADKLNVIPNVGMFQIAFARLGIPWQSVKISSIHSKDMGEWTKEASLNRAGHGMFSLLKDCQSQHLIACYTSPENSASRIASMLKIEGMNDEFELLIASHLTRESEVLTDWLTVSNVIGQDYPDPNLVLLRRIKTNKNSSPVMFGHADSHYFQRKPDKGLITKQEVRAVSLAKMRLRQDSVVWDIGAGSGSVGLEAARLCPHGHVLAIEKNVADYEIVKKNLIKSTLSNYHIELGKAPDGLQNWERPDGIFIGGSGGNLADLIELCLAWLKLEGTLVMNFVTIENLNTATEVLKKQENIEWEFIQMQVSRSKPILSMQRLQAENPVFVVTVTHSKDSISE